MTQNSHPWLTIRNENTQISLEHWSLHCLSLEFRVIFTFNTDFSNKKMPDSIIIKKLGNKPYGKQNILLKQAGCDDGFVMILR